MIASTGFVGIFRMCLGVSSRSDGSSIGTFPFCTGLFSSITSCLLCGDLSRLGDSSDCDFFLF